MRAGVLSRILGVSAVVVVAFTSCTLASSLEDLKRNADSGACVTNKNCSGCPTCATLCVCKSGANAVACLFACQDASNTGGTGGGIGCSGNPQECLGCCSNQHGQGVNEYGDMLETCVCGAASACGTSCGGYCKGEPASSECQACLAGNESCLQANCGAECQAFISCYSPCDVSG